MLDFPSSPTTGQSVTVGGVTWTWDGVKWTTSGSAGPALPLAMNDNRIINGDMRIDQRGAATSGGATAIGYTVDRWQFVASLTTKGGYSRATPSGNAAFPYCLGFQSNSAYAVLAGDYFVFLHRIEADMVSDFAWGSASAQAVTLSFWAQSSVSGTFGGAIRNMANTRSYPFSFALSATNWTKIAITIPGDTTGTWVMSGNAASMDVVFDLGSGSSNRAAAGAWIAGNYLGATGAASILATNSAFINLTGVKLEIGSVATPFNRQSLAKSMADCQRYYQTGQFWLGAAGTASQSFGYMVALGTAMRAASTITYSTPSTANCTGLTSTQITAQSFIAYATATASAFTNITATFAATAEL